MPAYFPRHVINDLWDCETSDSVILTHDIHHIYSPETNINTKSKLAVCVIIVMIHPFVHSFISQGHKQQVWRQQYSGETESLLITDLSGEQYAIGTDNTAVT